jgi:hypothetical protein
MSATLRGLCKKLVGTTPGKDAAFNHSKAKDDGVPCVAAVLSALKKVGVKV